MTKVNIVGDYKKSGLTQKELKGVVETVLYLVSPLSSSGFLPDQTVVQAGTRGSTTKIDSRLRGNDNITHKKINIAFVRPNKIRNLNREYRKIDKPTDVLSFDYGDEGDILLCIDLIQEMKDGSESLSEAVQKTLIHGILHLFNYNHESKKERAIMEKLEEKIFLQLSFPRRRESK